MAEAAADLHRIATAAVDDLLAADPVAATWLGDHRFDDQLPEQSSAAHVDLAQRIDDHLTALDAIDDIALDPSSQVDLEILRAALAKAAFEAREWRSSTWNPMEWNPGTALYLLTARDFAPLEERLASVRGRLAHVPDFLSEARAELDDMPAIHVETAIAQLTGTRELILGRIGPELIDAQGLIDASVRAVDGFIDWLRERLPDAHRSPRAGERTYAAMLWHRLDDPIAAAKILRQAEDFLDEVTAEMREVAAAYLGESPGTSGVVHRALAQVAARSTVDDSTVLTIVREAVERTMSFTREHDLVTVPDIDVHVIEMPEIHRGVAVAYCDAPGPLEGASVPTFVAVSPTPQGWTDERKASFYREYNGVQLHDLTIHEAFPGHVLQLAHARGLNASLVRRFGMSGSFVEGWAVYAEELAISRGYLPGDWPDAALGLRLQQLKMQARMAINAILDVKVHATDLTEPEAIDLMMRRGFQEEGEAIGKWRRALLTVAQLPTYFVGFQAVREIVNDLRVLHPDWSDRQVHDLVLGFGSPAPRHLRSLIGI